MTMYVAAGSGEMPKEDLKATLDDLEATAVQEERTFWMLVQASAEPTSTDRSLMAWVKEHETYFETYGPDAAKADDIYKGTQEKHAVKGIVKKIVDLMNEKPEDGEDACLLALFASDDPAAPEDAELYEIVEAVLSAGFPVYAFNDGMGEIGLNEDAIPEPEDPEEIVPPDSTPETEEIPEVPTSEEWTQAQLEGLDGEEVRAIAAGFGITLKPRTRTATYIDAILNRNQVEEPAEVEVEESVGDIQAEEIEEEAQSNGHTTDPYDVVKGILRALGEALLAAAK